MAKFDAMIFDCDGVLVNSEEIVQDIELELLAAHGLLYDREEFAHRFLGVANEYFYQTLNDDSMEQLGVPLPTDFSEALHRKAREAFDTRLTAFPGTHELAAFWPKKLAVASSSSIEGLAYKLNKTNLTSYFGEHIYSADHVGIGKPDPAIYLHTAQQLKVAPENCLVIEDSVNGVVSGISAGMQVIGFSAGKHCLAGHDEKLLQAGAKFTVNSMTELQQHLARLV